MNGRHGSLKRGSQPLRQFSSLVTNNSIVLDRRSQGPTLYLLNTWLPLGVVPPCHGGNYCNCHCFLFFLIEGRKKKERKFSLPPPPPPSSSFFFHRPLLWPPRVHGTNCVHFNYDLIFKGAAVEGGSAGGGGRGAIHLHAFCLSVCVYQCACVAAGGFWVEA